MIVPIVTAETRYHLAIENDERGCASVEIYHGPTLPSGRELLEVLVTCDDEEEVEVAFRVRQR